jgi:hypothetical protein
MRVLQQRKIRPFGEHCIGDYFKRIEFHHKGSPHAHLLIWLENNPFEEISEDMTNTAALTDRLFSVSRDIQNYGNQMHKHTFMSQKTDNKCRFNIPYWPMDTTRILIPMSSDDGHRAGYKKKASKIRQYLELKTYDMVKAFWEDHNSEDLEEYLNIICASISRPSVMIKRQMMELWTNTFHL